MILNEEEKNAVAATHGVTPDKVNTVIEPVLKNDVIVELSIVNSSEGLNFAILQPSTKIVSGMMQMHLLKIVRRMAGIRQD